MTSFSRFTSVFWLDECETVEIVDMFRFFNIRFIVVVWTLISFCFYYLISLVNLSLCDVDITIFLFFYSIVIAEKIIDMKKRKTFTLNIVVFATCSTILLRNVFFVLIQFFFLLSILCVIQRDFLDTHRSDDDSFASSRRNAQCDVSLRNIHMFACFDTHMFCDRIFDIWSIVEYDSSTRNISLFSTYTRAICHDVSIYLSCRRSLISTSSTKNSSYDFFSKFIVYFLFLSSSEM